MAYYDVVLGAISGAGKIKELKWKLYIVIQINADKPLTLNIGIVGQRVIIAGQDSSFWLKFDDFVAFRTSEWSWYWNTRR